MDQVDLPGPQQKDALAQFAWPERFAPFAQGYTGEGMRIETPADIATRDTFINQPIVKSRTVSVVNGGNEPSGDNVGRVQTYRELPPFREVSDRQLAFMGDKPVAAWLRYASSYIAGLPLNKPGKQPRLEFVWTPQGHAIEAIRVYTNATPRQFDGELAEIVQFDFDAPEHRPANKTASGFVTPEYYWQNRHGYLWHRDLAPNGTIRPMMMTGIKLDRDEYDAAFVRGGQVVNKVAVNHILYENNLAGFFKIGIQHPENFMRNFVQSAPQQ